MKIHLSNLKNSFSPPRTQIIFQSNSEATCILHSGQRWVEQLLSLNTFCCECKRTLRTCDNRWYNVQGRCQIHRWVHRNHILNIPAKSFTFYRWTTESVWMDCEIKLSESSDRFNLKQSSFHEYYCETQNPCWLSSHAVYHFHQQILY